MKKQQMREKLVKLLDKGPAEYAVGSEGIADYLIAHGVTVQDEPIKMVIPEGVDEKRLIEMLHNAPLQIFPCEPAQEWISVKDRLPKEDEDIIAFCYYHESWQAQVCHHITLEAMMLLRGDGGHNKTLLFGRKNGSNSLRKENEYA